MEQKGNYQNNDVSNIGMIPCAFSILAKGHPKSLK